MEWNEKLWKNSVKEFAEFMTPLTATVGRTERRVAATRYIEGLLIPGQRKSIEPMAERLGAQYMEVARASAADFSAEEAVRFSVFQYMVGNTDWSMTEFHNAEILLSAEGVNVPVPYDFDWTGLVSARYARPDARLRIRTVRDRLYRGFCRPGFDFSAVYAQFIEIRTELEALYSNQQGLEQDNRRDAVAYLTDFYEDIESPRRARDRLEENCRDMSR